MKTRKNLLVGTGGGFEHPYEYKLYQVDARDYDEPFYICPTCERKVQRLFALAHDPREAQMKFEMEVNSKGVPLIGCGYCTSTLIAADESGMVIVAKGAKVHA